MSVRERIAHAAGWSCLALLLAQPALAVDGVAEIDHACAVHTGCFPGDAPGYPVTLDGSAGSSYRLTSDLLVPDADTDGLLAEAPRLRIDLGGFRIVRDGCQATTTSCLLSGSGSGIYAFGYPGVEVTNGSVIGMGENGVRLGDNAVVHRMRLFWNGVYGARVGWAGRISESIARENGSDGLTGSRSLIRNSVAHRNGGMGLNGSLSGVVHHNASYENQGTGISLAGSAVGNAVHGSGGQGMKSSTVVGNAVRSSSGIGILIPDVLVGNALTSGQSDGVLSVATFSSVLRGNALFDNAGSGAVASIGSSGLVHGNAAHGNQVFGLDLAPATGFAENVVTDNLGGTVDDGVDLGANSCDGLPSC